MADHDLQFNGDLGDEKRRWPRAPLQLLIQHRFSSLEDFVAQHATDLSMGGLFIRTQEPRAEGALVYLQFSLRSGEKLIEGLGRVVRVNPPSSSPERIPGMGIEFVNFDDDSLSLIAQIVSARLKRRRPAQPD